MDQEQSESLREKKFGAVETGEELAEWRMPHQKCLKTLGLPNRKKVVSET